jgi:hypothetical protein
VIAGLPGARLVTARLLAFLALAGRAAAVALAASPRGPASTALSRLLQAPCYSRSSTWRSEPRSGPPSATPSGGTTPRAGHARLVPMDVDLPSRHGGRLGDLGWALAWVIGALVAAFVVVSATTRVAGSRRGSAPRLCQDQLGAAVSRRTDGPPARGSRQRGGRPPRRPALPPHQGIWPCLPQIRGVELSQRPSSAVPHPSRSNRGADVRADSPPEPAHGSTLSPEPNPTSSSPAPRTRISHSGPGGPRRCWPPLRPSTTAADPGCVDDHELTAT